MIILLMGVTGSGKTTIGRMLSNELGWEFYDGDEFHSEVNINKMKQGIPLNDNDRMPWLNIIRKIIDKCIKENKDAIVACSALKEYYRNFLIQDNKEIMLVYLRGNLSIIQSRLENRKDHFMNPRLLASQFDILEEPKNAIFIDISQELNNIIKLIKTKLFI